MQVNYHRIIKRSPLYRNKYFKNLLMEKSGHRVFFHYANGVFTYLGVGGLVERNRTRRDSLLHQSGLIIMVKAFESDGGNSYMIKKNENGVE